MAHKRVVLAHLTGTLAGLLQIMGTIDVLDQYPNTIPTVDFGDHQAGVQLTQVRDRYVVYTEVLAVAPVTLPPASAPEKS